MKKTATEVQFEKHERVMVELRKEVGVFINEAEEYITKARDRIRLLQSIFQTLQFPK